MTDLTGYGTDQALALELLVLAVNGSTNDGTHPEGWLEAGGPIHNARGRYGTRHVLDHGGLRGYKLCGALDAEPDTEPIQ